MISVEVSIVWGTKSLSSRHRGARGVPNLLCAKQKFGMADLLMLLLQPAHPLASCRRLSATIIPNLEILAHALAQNEVESQR